MVTLMPVNLRAVAHDPAIGVMAMHNKTLHKTLYFTYNNWNPSVMRL